MNTERNDPFPNDATTKWDVVDGSVDRVMYLINEFSYHDPHGKTWTVPAGAWLNGASIPRALWSAVGSPFAGNYRLASIVHDYFVGEGPNPDVDPPARKAADKMFYFACRDGGCSRKFARLLYIAVRFGSWLAKQEKSVDGQIPPAESEWVRDCPQDDLIRAKFWEIADAAEVDVKGEDVKGEDDLDALDNLITKKLSDASATWQK